MNQFKCHPSVGCQLTTAIIVATMLFFPSSIHAVDFEGCVLEPGISLKGLSIPIGQSERTGPLLIMKVSEIFMKPTNIGFLSISVIQRIVFRDCELIIPETSRSSSWARSLMDFIRNQKFISGAEIQGFKLCYNDGGQIFLKAQGGRFSPLRGQISLHGVVWRDKKGEHVVDSACILLEGISAGYLRWQGDQSLELADPR